MMRPSLSQGGVLSGGEQSQLHDKVRGVGYRTEQQRADALAKLVRPFQSQLLQQGGKENANVQQQQQLQQAPALIVPAPSRARSASRRSSSVSRPSSAAAPTTVNRPTAASSSHKKSASFSCSVVTSNHHSRSGSASSNKKASVASGGVSSSGPPEPQAPSWIANAVHQPDRPNAPSQMTAEQRAAVHRPRSTNSANGSGAMQQPQQQPRVAKSHKLISRPYAKPDTASTPRQRDEAFAQVSIERHARPLVIRPADAPRGAKPLVKFVPIGHVVGVRPIVKGDGGAAQHQPPFYSPAISFEQYQQEQQQMQEAELQYQRQQHQWQQQQQHHPHHPLQTSEQKHVSESAPPAFPSSSSTSNSSTLQTPHINSTGEAPRPYSDAFQQQQHAANMPPHPPQLIVATSTEPQPITVLQSPTAANAIGIDDPLSSPSPARSAPRPATSQQQQQQRSSSNNLLNSPALERKRLEAEHEKKMKSYLSPTNRARVAHTGTTGSQSSARKKQAAQTIFTPNPHAGTDAKTATGDSESIPLSLDDDNVDGASSSSMVAVAAPSRSVSSSAGASAPAAPSHAGAGVSHSSSSSSLFYDPVVERPVDLPPVPVEHLAPTLLYPPAKSDPLRSLAADLRGPGLKYEASSGLSPIGMDDTPLSPQGHRYAGVDRAEELANAVAAELDAVVRERAQARAELQRAHKSKWDSKIAQLKQASLQASLSARALRSPLTSPKRQDEKPFSFTQSQQHQQPTSALAAAMPSIAQRLEEAAAASSASPSQAAVPAPSSAGVAVDGASPAAATAAANSTAHKLVGERITDPIIVTHANKRAPSLQQKLQHQQQPQSNNGSGPLDPVAQRVTFSATSKTSPTAAVPAAASTPSAPSSSSPPSSLPRVRRFVVGTTNAAKLQAVRETVSLVFGLASDNNTSSPRPAEGTIHPSAPAFDPHRRPAEVVGVEVESGVSAQPLSGQETLRGAVQRAKAALQADPLAEFGVGIEGGLEQLHPQQAESSASTSASGIDARWFQAGWVAVVDRFGLVGTGSSARFEVADVVASELRAGRVEMADLVDRLSGQTGVRHKAGFMGLVTNGLLPRAECYKHGVLFALAPFISAPVYWHAQTSTKDANGTPKAQ